MAGIILDVENDLQKLSRLKKAIDEVKTSLKSINVKVDVDIARGLEAQLKTLTTQFDNIIKKVAEAEGKILLSVSNINKASDKILQSQDKVSKMATNPISSAPQQAATGDISAINAEAKAYKELESEINAIIGTREANIKRMLDETNAIRLKNAEIKRMTKYQGESTTLSSSQQKRLEQLNNELLTHKTALSEVRQILSNNVKMDNAAATSMNSLSQSLSRMRVTYRELSEEERNSPFGKELLASINQADTKIKELDATIGNHARNVGNYKKEWNGLQYQMQMVARELPNFAISPQIGILSLTNNIPYLVDELKKAKDAHKSYITEVKAGNKDLKEVPSLTKQILSSLFSWQTGIVMVITLITAYRQEIGEWVASLFNAKIANEELKKSTIELNGQIQSEVAIANNLFLSLKKAKEGTEEYNRVKLSIQNKYGDILNNLDSEKRLLKDIEGAQRGITDAIKETVSERLKDSFLSKAGEEYGKSQADALLTIRNRVIEDLGSDAGQKLYESIKESLSHYSGNDESGSFYSGIVKQMKLAGVKADAFGYSAEITDAILKYTNASNSLNQAIKDAEDIYSGESKVKNIFADANKEISGTIEKIKQLEKEIADIRSGISKPKGVSALNAISIREQEISKLKSNLVSLTGNKIESSYKLREQYEKFKLLQEKQGLDRAKQARDLEYEVTQSRIDAMQEGSEKTLAQMQFDHQKEIEALGRNREDYLRKRIEAERAAFEANPENKGKTFDSSSITLTKEEENAFNILLEYKIVDQGNEITSYHKDLLSKYQGYTEKRIAAQKKYQQDREALIKAGASKEAIAELDYQTDETLKSIDNEFAMREDSFKKWANNITNLSLEELRKLLYQAEQELQRSEFLNPNDPKLAQQRAKIESLKNTISNKTDVSPDKRSQKEWQDLYKTLSKVDQEFDEIGRTVGGTAGEIISAAGSISSSTLKMVDGIANVADSSTWAIKSTATAAEKAIQAVENASVILAVISAAIKVVTTLISVFSKTAKEKAEFESLKSTTEALIKLWDDLIDRKKEYISMNAGESAIMASREALDALEKQVEATKNLARATLDVTNGGHSMKYRMWEGSYKYNGQNWKDVAPEIEKELGVPFKGMSDMLNMSSDQLQWIKDHYIGFWVSMDDTYKEQLETLIKSKKEAEEIGDALKESLTQISFDSVRSNFKDMLLDMTSDGEDWADNFEKMMQRAVIGNFVDSKDFQNKLKAWYEDFSNAMKNGLDEGERNELRNRYNEIVQEGVDFRNEAMETMGWSSGEYVQTATSKGFQAMSQDTGDELNGRFTALQMSGEEIKSQGELRNQLLNQLNTRIEEVITLNAEHTSIADDTRNIIVASYLELQSIRDNTATANKYLKDIKSDISDVNKNTKKLAG